MTDLSVDYIKNYSTIGLVNDYVFRKKTNEVQLGWFYLI